MNPAKLLPFVALAAFALCSPGGRRLAAQASPENKLWLAIGVAKPVYQLAEIPKLQVDFAVVNDGDTITDPGIGSSHLFINGAEPKDWNLVINNGVRTSAFAALPSGQLLYFSYQLGGRYFGAPGIYTVRWQVRSFWSPEIVFRVMPGGR